jgi:hypothetical protein
MRPIKYLRESGGAWYYTSRDERFRGGLTGYAGAWENVAGVWEG